MAGKRGNPGGASFAWRASGNFTPFFCKLVPACETKVKCRNANINIVPAGNDSLRSVDCTLKFFLFRASK
jgi:hypothetical protein